MAFKSLQPNESLQDGCDSHSCKVNEKGEFIWERRITGCPPFDSRRCLAEGVSSEMPPVSRLNIDSAMFMVLYIGTLCV